MAVGWKVSLDMMQHKCTGWSYHSASQLSFYRRRMRLLKLFAGGECQACGDDDLDGLEFHHFVPGEDVSRVWSSHRVFHELAKTQLLCKSCHKLVHARVGKKRLEPLKAVWPHVWSTYQKRVPLRRPVIW